MSDSSRVYLCSPSFAASPRVGPLFQAHLPNKIIPHNKQQNQSQTNNIANNTEIEGEPVWLPQQFKDDSQQLDAYLRTVENLFVASPENYSEELALEFLHRCMYDLKQATLLVQPWAKSEADEIDEKQSEFDSDDMCSVCGDGGDLIICDAKGCKRVYHAVCAELTQVPSGVWECPIHFCATCRIRVGDSSLQCVTCPTAFCTTHIPPYARSRHDALKHGEFKCPRCNGMRDVVNSDRRAFLTQLIHALSGASSNVNLKDLYREMTVRGGIDEVINTPAWREVQRLFFNPHVKSTHK